MSDQNQNQNQNQKQEHETHPIVERMRKDARRHRGAANIVTWLSVISGLGAVVCAWRVNPYLGMGVVSGTLAVLLLRDAPQKRRISRAMEMAADELQWMQTACGCVACRGKRAASSEPAPESDGPDFNDPDWWKNTEN